MFQSGDNASSADNQSRRNWMATLARAPLDLLESSLSSHAAQTPQWLRAPETGLMMVQGRVGGTGERFNLGEVTVTRCVLRLGIRGDANARIGVAYVMGRSHRKAHLAALADAMLQDESHRQRLQTSLIAPTQAHLNRVRAERHARAQSTKVEFFTVSRETNGTEERGDDDQ
jgi:alpha-D-ribose 1-methylphosphonate 5-triphosphate synthase subunit PhnG